MNPLLIKGLVAVGGTGLGGIGIWQITEHMTPKTIQEKLEREGISFLSTEDDQMLNKWKTLYDNNNSSNSGDQPPGKIDTSTETESGSDNQEARKMRSACKKLMLKGLSDANEGEMNKVKVRCSAPAQD